jgi:pimeloyl-ACP methyl ester carboxylesterase
MGEGQTLRSRRGEGPSWVVGSIVAGALAFATAAQADGGFGATCESVNFQVALDDTSAPTFKVVGELCSPPFDGHRTLQILLHGATYNRSYWDFPFRPDQYSYVRYANNAGFATLALDRLGSGASDKPSGEEVTVHASASTIHQIITAVRAGSVFGADGRRIHYDRIALVGHSFGSNVAWTEAGTYQDVDGVVLSGISHLTNPPGAAVAMANIYPAQFDPLFAGANLPANYFTTLPGTRGTLFYFLPGADPNVVALDEATKDVVPLGLFLDQFTTYGLTQNIHVPVLNVDGNHDTLSCNLPSCIESGSLDNEASFYPPDACYTKVIIPDAGHDVNLHRDAPLWFTVAQAWALEHLGFGGALPPVRGCGRRL